MSNKLAPTPRNRFVAAGPYDGYALQEIRLVARLLDAGPQDIVSLEVFDDVGVETPDGDVIAEQSKSTQDANPVSDRAVGLWKTLSNWLTAASEGHLNIAATRFFIYTSKDVTGPIVSGFSAANTTDAAKEALITARDTLWGPAPTYEKRSAVANSIRTFVETVLLEDENVVCELIKRFSLLCGSGNPIADVELKLQGWPVSKRFTADLAAHAFGWVKTQVSHLHANGKPAFISKADFLTEMTAFSQKLDRREILHRFAEQPSEEQIKFEVCHRTYVRQLDLIDCDYDTKVSAVVDFLQASIDRTKWSELGLVHESSFDEFEDNLKRVWKNKKTTTDISHRDKCEADRGKLLLSDCSQHVLSLENNALPPHFVPGSFHSLADQAVIGWHPDFQRILKSNSDLLEDA